MNTEVTVKPWFSEFRDRIAGGLRTATEHIATVAATYVEAIDRDPAFKDYLIDELPEVSGGIWRSLKQVGRGMLDARIATGGVPYGNKLRRLPVSEQRQAMDGTLPLLTASGDTLCIKLDAMMPRQAEQVFASGHIRSLPEQKAWIESKALEVARSAKPAQSIEIDKKRRRIVVNGCVMTAADLMDYLRKITE